MKKKNRKLAFVAIIGISVFIVIFGVFLIFLTQEVGQNQLYPSSEKYWCDADLDSYYASGPETGTCQNLELERLPSLEASASNPNPGTTLSVIPEASNIATNLTPETIGFTSCIPAGCSSQAGNDCNDANASINFFATEICDGVDNNCDRTVDEGCTPAGGGGGGGSVGIRGQKTSQSPVYDIRIDVEDDSYFSGEDVDAVFTAQWKSGYLPGDDISLTYYLLSPTNKTFDLKKEFVKNGDYDLPLSRTLPNDAELGEWTFAVDWGTQKIEDRFYVTDDLGFRNIAAYLLAPLLVTIAIFAIYILRWRKKR